MKKKTAVDWLYDWVVGDFTPTKDAFDEAYETAKEMEKEQIIKAWEQRATPYPIEGMGYSIIDVTGEQYYNNTYETT